MSKNIYIDNMPVDQAIAKFKEATKIQFETMTIPVVVSSGFISAKPIFAKCSSPQYHCAAMDGIAVLSEQTKTANERNPLTLKEGMDFIYVNTGNPMPENMDSVIMIEEVVPLGEDTIQILKPSVPWQYIRQIGEDIVEGEMIIPSERVIRPQDLGALLSGGLDEVLVKRPLMVGILPTGTEIVQSIHKVSKGKILDSSSPMLAAMIEALGCKAVIYPAVVDQFDALKSAIDKGVRENDVLITIAGTSAGAKDYTAKVMSELGEIIVHGVAMKPGKPTILAKIDEKPVIGLPGYPASTFMAFTTFVEPLIQMHRTNTVKKVRAKLSQRLVSSLKHEEKVRVTLGHIDGNLIAVPLTRQASSTMSLVKADGILSIPRLSEGIEAGTDVDVELIESLERIKEKLVLIGSHDLILDLISDQMPLASAHVGSLGGILALRRRESHCSTVHLIHEETGIYNEFILDQYFKGEKMLLVEGVRRLQGIMVKPGNPMEIESLSDLVEKKAAFVNRQRGAGTRQLLDYKLKEAGIDPSDLLGYQREVNTHLAVAVSVKSEGADAGMGIYAAAKQMGLDFIPIGYEHYDFLIRGDFATDSRVENLLTILKSNEFRTQVEQIGGYVLDQPGRIMVGGEGND